MPTVMSSQIPPPANWQDFETLCCDLWKNIWHDPNTQKNGRQGQKQNGVDVYGRPNEDSKWAGVQCKGKENYSDKQITEQELQTEVEKAIQFKPNISQFIIATTGPRDAKIQETARHITDSHLNKGLFPVSIWHWDDIIIGLADYPELIEKHYPGLGIDIRKIKNDISDIHDKVREIHSSTVISIPSEDQNIVDHKSLETDLSKFDIPRYSSSIISRARILSQINDSLKDYRSIYLYAPSGFGKSILLSQLTDLKLPSICWIDCEHDNSNYDEFTRLLRSYIKAKFNRHIRDESPKHLATSIEEILKVSSEDILYLVFDHVDNIDTGIQSFIKEIMYQRSNIKIILAGTKFKFRKQKKLELNKLLRVIDYKVLTFNSEETRQLFRDIKISGIQKIPDEFITDVLDITEGWPIAIGLLKARVTEDNHCLATMINELQEISKTDLYEYLIEGYWTTLDKNFQLLLMNTSIYNCFDRSDAEAVLPDIEIAPYWSNLINDFEFIRNMSENLFIYHNMFKQFLSEQISRTFRPSELELLHEKACSQFLSKKIPTAAIYHAKKANNSQKILEATQLMVEWAFIESNYLLLQESLEEVSIDIRWSDATLSVYQGRYFQYFHKDKDALKWYERAQSLYEENDDEVWKIGIVNDIGSILRTIGKVDEAIDRYDNVLNQNKMDIPSVYIGEIIANRANCYTVKKMFDKAMKDYEKAEEIFKLHNRLRALPLIYLNKSSLFDETTQQKLLLDKALSLAVEYNCTDVMYKAGNALGQIYLKENNFSLASRPFKYAVDAFLQAGYMDENIPFILNNYGLSIALADEPKPDGIEPLLLSLRMKETSGLKVSGNLQNLTTLLIRLGHIDIVEPHIRNMIIVSEKEKKDAFLMFEGIVKLELLYKINNRSNDEFLLSKLSVLEKNPEKDKFRSVIRKMYAEGEIRMRLNYAAPLLSQISYNDNMPKLDDLLINIENQEYSMKDSSVILVTTKKDLSLKNYYNVADRNFENYLIEFLINADDIQEGTSHQLAIWFIRKNNICWVQNILWTREHQGSLKLEILSGQLFRVDEQRNDVIEEHHEKNCSCENIQIHKDIFDQANGIIRHKEKKLAVFPLTASGLEYQVVN